MPDFPDCHVYMSAFWLRQCISIYSGIVVMLSSVVDTIILLMLTRLSQLVFC